MRKNLSLKTTAEILGTSTRTVYRLLTDGELTAFRVRSALRIPETSIDEYQKRQIILYAEENGIPDRVGQGETVGFDQPEPSVRCCSQERRDVCLKT
jgi:excisionase family DNA binding protein